MGPSEFSNTVNWDNPWINLMGDTCSTPDLYNSCCPLGAFGMGVPANLLGFQYAHTGNGYAGLISFDAFAMGCSVLINTGWREYLEGHLSSPLVAGQQYCVSFYVSVPDNVAFATQNIGVYLSNSLVSVSCATLPGDASNLPLTPQLQYTGSFITDTVGWTLLEWSYTAAGGEQYITLGNYNDNTNTPYICNNAGAINPQGYYYVDDVSVVLGPCTSCPTLAIDTPTVIDASCYGVATGGFEVVASGGADPYDYYLSIGGNIIDSAINITGNNSFIGLGAGTYIVNVFDDNGCPGTITVVINQPPPVTPVITGVTTFCLGGSTTLDAGSGYSDYFWSNLQNTQTITVTASGDYSVTVTQGGCQGFDTITVLTTSGANATITSTGPYCVFDTAVLLSAVDPGGIWSGAGITDSLAGIFDPSLVGLGSHTVTYQIDGACGDTTTAQILVTSNLDANIDSVGEICSNLPAFNLAAATGGGTWSGPGITNASAGTFNPSIADTGTHQIIYFIGGSCGNSDTISLKVISCEITPVIYIPNIFSPNGDGINDILYVHGQGIESMTLIIYDRWGEKVFESTDPAYGWDGSFRNKQVDSGVFVYFLKAHLITGEDIKYKGNITVVR
jgi:gliding motility-associated-like protein